MHGNDKRAKGVDQQIVRYSEKRRSPVTASPDAAGSTWFAVRPISYWLWHKHRSIVGAAVVLTRRGAAVAKLFSIALARAHRHLGVEGTFIAESRMCAQESERGWETSEKGTATRRSPTGPSAFSDASPLGPLPMVLPGWASRQILGNSIGTVL